MITSFISEIRYNVFTQRLTVNFGRSVYAYASVPLFVFIAFRFNRDRSGYFRRQIRETYNFQRIA